MSRPAGSGNRTARLADDGGFDSIRCRRRRPAAHFSNTLPNPLKPLPLHHRIVLLLVCPLWAAIPLAAQDAPLLVEAQGGAAIPFGDLKDGQGPGMGTATGVSLSVVLAVPSEGWRTIYAGFSQHRFGCEAAGCDVDGRYVATGFNLGFRIVPVREGPVVPWIRLGVITTRVETGDLSASPESAADAGLTDLGFGGEAGVGILVPLGRSVGWSATGLVSAVDSDLPGGASLPLRYFTAHTGLTLLF